MKNGIRVLVVSLVLLAGAAPLFADGVRVQLEEVLFQIDAQGNSHPIDHQVIDVFPLRFENQYGTVEKTSEHGRYGASYFEVPAPAGGHLNHNVYLHIQDGPFSMVTDGYHNGQVPGALFKMTAMTMRRDGDKVRVRTMHVVQPPSTAAGVPYSGAMVRDLQRKVDALVRGTGSRG